MEMETQRRASAETAMVQLMAMLVGRRWCLAWAAAARTHKCLAAAVQFQLMVEAE